MVRTLVKRRAYVPLKGITIQRNKSKTKHYQPNRMPESQCGPSGILDKP